MLFRRNTLKIPGYRKVECKRIEIYLNANTNQERAGITILVSENVHFQGRNVTKCEEGNL